MTKYGDGDRSNERDCDGCNQHCTAPSALLRSRLARARLRDRLQENPTRVITFRDHLDNSDGLLQPFQLDRAAIDVDDAVDLPCEMHDFRAREDLAGTGFCRRGGRPGSGRRRGSRPRPQPLRPRRGRSPPGAEATGRRASPPRTAPAGRAPLGSPAVRRRRRRELHRHGARPPNPRARSDRVFGEIGELRRQLGRRLVASFMGEEGPAPDVRGRETCPDLRIVRRRATLRDARP